MIRKYSGKTHELWWQTEEKWFNNELERALDTYQRVFDRTPEVIAFREDTTFSYDGKLEVSYRKNIPSKNIFVLCLKENKNGTADS